MGNDQDYNHRLPNHEEPKRIEMHRDEPASTTPEATTASAAGRSTRHNIGSFAWAALAAIAAVVMVGAVYFFAPPVSVRDVDMTAKAEQIAGVPLYGTLRLNPVSAPAATAPRYITHVGYATDNAQIATPNAQDIVNTAQTGAETAAASGRDVVIFFPTNGSSIPDNAALNQLCKAALASGDNVTVVAYTDPTGPKAFNDRLSRSRAAHVGDYLVAHGVPRNHVTTSGMGPSKDYPDNARNRRAVVHIAQ